MLDEGGDSSQGTRSTSNLKREWTEGPVKFLVDLCEEKYWEYNRKPFKKANWESFAEHLNTQFPEEPQRTWQQTRDKWNKMRSTYQEEKVKQEETGAAASTWTPWYERFDNIFGGTAKINGVPNGLDQGVRLKHSEAFVLSDDDEDTLPTPPPHPSAPNTASSHSPRSEAVNQPGCEGQVNRNAGKRKRKLAMGDESIVSAINNFSKGILEVEKMKLQLTEKMIDHEREGREMLMKGQLQMAALFADVLKAKDSSGSSK